MPRPVIGAATGIALAARRLLGARMHVMGRPVLALTTVGATSGATRRTVLCWFPDGENRWLIVASFGGSARHPAWYLNMAKNPDKVWIEIDGRKLKVEAHSLKGAEREQAWRQIVSLAPGFAGYQQKTDREIPVVRLQPAPQST